MFSVEDQGHGIPGEVMQIINWLFKNTAESNKIGSGIGLASCHFLCEKIGEGMVIETSNEGTKI